MSESDNPQLKEMENLENDFEIKKKIIQTKIINNNYNKDHFLDFCSAKRSDGENLNRWTISEFEDIVNEYIKYHQDDEYKAEERKKEIFFNQRKEKDLNLEISSFLINNQNSNETKETEIQCKILEKSILNDKKVKIEVKNPKCISESYFQSSYIQYEVTTNITNWFVYRRYSDFEWLRLSLRKLYPSFFCPPIPKKKIRFKKI